MDDAFKQSALAYHRSPTHRLAPAVAQAAIEAGVARRPIADMAAYRAQLAARRLQAFPHPTN
ncbi:hypothetical protein E5S69_23555 [Cupriavidus necator]|uniref:hypothetical protein n=1 Tax=Cupriavidus necator TaxID=106590 RepID=UPI00148FC024|nr:hypothetical protein [Cupriavidus necator]NOV26488.1 hypothetical protein [Cupriavidus necator]